MSSGLPWIQVQVGMPDHPKLRALALELGIDRVQAVGHAVVLWTSIGRLAPQGVLSTPHADLVLEQMAGWTGESGRFAAASVACGLVDRVEAGLRVHDWDDHAGAFVEKSQRDAERQRKRRALLKQQLASDGCHADVTRTTGGRHADVQGEREIEREIEKPSPASPVATDSQKKEAVEANAPKREPKPHTPSAQEQIARTLAAARTKAHPELTPWPLETGDFVKVVNKQFKVGSELRQAHDADPALFLRAFEHYLADPFWKLNGGYPLGGFLGKSKWREHLDSVRSLQPSSLFRNAARPGERILDPYAEDSQ